MSKKVDIEALARQLTTAQIRQLAQLVESAPELARLKARREEILAGIADVKADIANITNVAPPRAPKPEKAVKSRSRARHSSNAATVDKLPADVDARRELPSELKCIGAPICSVDAAAAPEGAMPQPSALDHAPDTCSQSGEPTDDSTKSTQLPVPNDAGMVVEAETASDGAADAAPGVPVDDSAQPSIPENAAKTETGGSLSH